MCIYIYIYINVYRHWYTDAFIYMYVYTHIYVWHIKQLPLEKIDSKKIDSYELLLFVSRSLSLSLSLYTRHIFPLYLSLSLSCHRFALFGGSTTRYTALYVQTHTRTHNPRPCLFRCWGIIPYIHVFVCVCLCVHLHACVCACMTLSQFSHTDTHVWMHIWNTQIANGVQIGEAVGSLYESFDPDIVQELHPQEVR